MYEIYYGNQYKRDIKRCKKRQMDMTLLKNTVLRLCKTGKLPKIYKAHKLKGKYTGMMECHIKPDWLLVWQQNDKAKTLKFERTGTHSDLF